MNSKDLNIILGFIDNAVRETVIDEEVGEELKEFADWLAD